jgi:hypothetical protein
LKAYGFNEKIPDTKEELVYSLGNGEMVRVVVNKDQIPLDEDHYFKDTTLKMKYPFVLLIKTDDTCNGPNFMVPAFIHVLDDLTMKDLRKLSSHISPEMFAFHNLAILVKSQIILSISKSGDKYQVKQHFVDAVFSVNRKADSMHLYECGC